jgi:hypothetical protein
MPLVTQADPRGPLAARAQLEFQVLAPVLLAAQQSGQLIDFNPEFQVGILMLRFMGPAVEATESASRLFSRPVYSTASDALRAVPHYRPTQRVSAGGIFQGFYVYLYDSCFEGDVPLNAHVIAILKDDTNVVQAKRQFNEQDDGNSDGQFYECFDWTNDSEVVPGYKVTFKVYNAPGGTLLSTYTATAPMITFTSLNKATAQVSGRGPAGKAFELNWSQEKLNAAREWTSETVSGTISAARTWSGDVSAGRIRGNALINMRVYQTTNIAFARSMLAPRIFCQLGGNQCNISGFPHQSLTLRVIKAGTTYTFSGQADNLGIFEVELFTPAGLPIKINSGVKVGGTNVALYTQPALSINPFDFANDIISGKAPPSRFFDVWVETYSHGWYSYWRGSNAQGNFSVDTTADFDLVDTETSQSRIRYLDPVSGNLTILYKVYAP